MNHVFSVCPVGYLAMNGDVPGTGLLGGYSASLDKCKNDCDGRSNCNSFMHSTSSDQCVLYEELTPTSPKYLDYQFCKKKSGTKII